MISQTGALLASATILATISAGDVAAYDSKSVATEALSKYITCAQAHARAMKYKTKSEMDASKPGTAYCSDEDNKYRIYCAEFERERPDLGKVCALMYVIETMKMYTRLGLK